MPLSPQGAGILQTGVQGGFSIGGNLFSAREAKKAYERNRRLYEEDRDWQAYMSNTAWQRGVADMLKAGINPMMAVSQGGAGQPNSSPSVAQSEPIAELSAGMHSAAKAANLLSIQQQAANIKLTEATAFKTMQEGNTAREIAANAGERQKFELLKIQDEMRGILARADVDEATKKQIEDMLPLLMATEKARTKLTEQQTASAKQSSELESTKFAEAEATERWYESMGTGNMAMQFFKQILELFRRSR